MTSFKIFYEQINDANNIIKNIVLPESYNYNTDKKKVKKNKKIKIQTNKKNKIKTDKKALNIFKKKMKIVNEDFNIIKQNAWRNSEFFLRNRAYDILEWTNIIAEYRHQLEQKTYLKQNILITIK